VGRTPFLTPGRSSSASASLMRSLFSSRLTSLWRLKKLPRADKCQIVHSIEHIFAAVRIQLPHDACVQSLELGRGELPESALHPVAGAVGLHRLYFVIVRSFRGLSLSIRTRNTVEGWSGLSLTERLGDLTQVLGIRAIAHDSVVFR